jgi:predicted small secreted protein
MRHKYKEVVMMGIMLITIIMVMLFLACNTVEAMGKGIKGTSNALQKVAKKNKS